MILTGLVKTIELFGVQFQCRLALDSPLLVFSIGLSTDVNIIIFRYILPYEGHCLLASRTTGQISPISFSSSSLF